MNAIALTPAVLAVLAEGVDRLEDGDNNMRRQAEEVRKTMAREHGLILSGFQWHPADQATSGYVRPEVYASQSASGKWHVDGYGEQELAPGQVLYLDIDCTIPLRTL